MIRNDRNIAIAALVVATLAFVAIWLAGKGESHGTADAEKMAATQSDRYHSTYDDAQKHISDRPYDSAEPYDDGSPQRKAELFSFDPNTADSTQLLRLGLRPWQVRNIYKYRARGGIYQRKEDFAQLYGLTVGQYRQLEPYIHIGRDYQPASVLFRGHTRTERDTTNFPVKLKETEHVVLNTADTNELKRVPGIGTYYAKEIVRHGQWLGGYVSTDQLDEIDGFPQAAKKYLVVENPATRKLKINQLTLQQLRRHPYINFYQAKAITDYRRLHGNIKSLQELRFSRDFPPEAILRLEPYVEY